MHCYGELFEAVLRLVFEDVLLSSPTHFETQNSLQKYAPPKISTLKRLLDKYKPRAYDDYRNFTRLTTILTTIHCSLYMVKTNNADQNI